MHEMDIWDIDEGLSDEDSIQAGTAVSRTSLRGRPKLSKLSLVMVTDELLCESAAFHYPKQSEYDGMIETVQQENLHRVNINSQKTQVFVLKEGIAVAERLSSDAD